MNRGPALAATAALCGLLVGTMATFERSGSAGSDASAESEPRAAIAPATATAPRSDAGTRVAERVRSSPSAVAVLGDSPAGAKAGGKTLPAALTDFEQWFAGSEGSGRSGDRAWVAEGVSLARARREAMRGLIQSDPATALAVTLTPRVRAMLPAEVAAQTEREIQGEGDYFVVAVCDHSPGGHGAGCRIQREVILGGERFDAHVFGERVHRMTQEGASLYGVAVDDQLALAEGDHVVFDASDLPEGRTAGRAHALVIRGQTYPFDDIGELAALWSAAGGDAGIPIAESGPTFDPNISMERTTPPTEAYNEYTGTFPHQKGPKAVLVLLVQPSDGAAWTNPPTHASLEPGLLGTSEFFYGESYRQAWFGPKYRFPEQPNEILIERLVVSPVLVLPKTRAEYLASWSTLRTDAVAAVRALGGEWTGNGSKDPNHFDRWAIMSNTGLINSSGVGEVGGKGLWPGGSLGGGIATHEFGHTWGFYHANFWDHAGERPPRSPDNGHVEYGDGADMMAGGSTGGFNAMIKDTLGFLERTRGEVLEVASSGTYRLFDHADSNARNPTSLVRALLLPITGNASSSKRLYLGFRHTNGTPGGPARVDWDQNAVQVHSARTSPTSTENSGSHFLDTSPGSNQTDDKIDGAIKIGRTYSEPADLNGSHLYGGLHVTPVARGNATSTDGNTTRTHEWIDVVVNYGNGISPANRAPTASFVQQTFSATPGVALALTVDATEPDGETMAYDWRFGDGAYSIVNSATQTKTWTSLGIYRVDCTVSDLKGGTADASCWVNVGNIAPKDPSVPGATIPGIAYKYYEGSFSGMPDFGSLVPKKTGTAPAIDISLRDRNDAFAFLFEGYIDVPAEEVYTFLVRAEDGANLYIGNALVVGNGGDKTSARQESGNVLLRPGRHAIRIEFFHREGAEELSVKWSTLGTAPVEIPASALTRDDPAATLPPTVSILAPQEGSSVPLWSDVELQAQAHHPEGIEKVQYYSEGTLLGEAADPPYAVAWRDVSAGTKSVEAIAYTADGDYGTSLPVTFHVQGRGQGNSIGLNFIGGGGSEATLQSQELAGAEDPAPNWNNMAGANGSVTGLRDRYGAATPTQVNWGFGYPGGGWGTSLGYTGSPNGKLMRGFVQRASHISGAPQVSVTGIPFAQYDLYVYADFSENSGHDTQRQQIRCLPAEGTGSPTHRFLRNSAIAGDGVGDYPNYDAWIGFREATATSGNATDSESYGNFVAFRDLTARGLTLEIDHGSTTSIARHLSAIQIVERPATIPRVRVLASGSGTSAAEGGPPDAYQIALTLAPALNVTVTIHPGSQLTVDRTSVTFTPTDWSTPRIVSVRAVDDTLAEGAHAGTITHTVSATGDYAAAPAEHLDVTITDNDLASVTVQAVGIAREGNPATAASFLLARGSISSLAQPLSVAFKLSGTGVSPGSFTLGAAVVTYNASSGDGVAVIPADQSQVNLTLSPIADGLVEGLQTVRLTIQSGPDYTPASPGEATMNIEDADGVSYYFTQKFGPDTLGGFDENTFDLTNRSVLFVPDGSPHHYSATLFSNVWSFPTSTANHTVIDALPPSGGNVDDGYWTIEQPVVFYGVTYPRFHVYSNGGVTFDVGDSTNPYTIARHFSKRRVAGYSQNLDPDQGSGAIYFGRVTTPGQERSVVTFSAVEVWSSTGSSANKVNFQISLFDSGNISIAWLSCVQSWQPVVGLSNRTTSATPPNFVETNFSHINPPGQAAPLFCTTPPSSAMQGQTFTYLIGCSDPNGDALTITASTKPAWLSLTDHGNGTATLTGTSPSAGSSAVALSVSDGGRTANQTFSLLVLPAAGNTPPAFTSVPQSAASAGEAYAYTVTVTDADGHPVTVSSVGLPTWLTLSDHGNGIATLAGTVPASGISTEQVVLLAGDGIDWAVQDFTITVQLPPEVTLTSPADGATVTAPGSILLQASASDPDGTVASVKFYNGPTLLHTDLTAPYEYLWTSVPKGTYALSAAATDNGGATTTSTAATIRVQGTTPPTVITLVPGDDSTEVPLGSNLSITFSDTILKGSGNFTLTNLTDGTSVTVPVGDPSVTVSGATLTINPAADLLAGKSYAVSAQAGVVVDLDGNPFGGLSGTAGWNFSTTSPASMTSQVFSASGVATDGTLVGAVNFNSTVMVNNVTFTARNATGANAIPLSGNVTVNVFNGSAAISATVGGTPGGTGLYDFGLYTNNNASNGNVAFSGLTVGQEYRVQFFIGDSRSGSIGNRSVNVWTQGNRTGPPAVGNLDYTSAAGGGENQIITHTFVAAGTSRSFFIGIDDNGDYSDGYGGVNAYPGHLNALQLRALVAQPSLLPPATLSASAVSDARIDLGWTDTNTGETGYKIYRKAGPGGAWGQVATASANATGYSDTGLDPATEYFYRVRTTDGTNDSADSTETSATTWTSFAGWKASRGMTPGDDASMDWDGNGAPELLDYLFANDLVSGEPPHAPTVRLVSGPEVNGDDRYLEIEFRRRKPHGGVGYRARASENLTAWGTPTGVQEAVLDASDPEFDRIALRIPAAAAQRLFGTVEVFETTPP